MILFDFQIPELAEEEENFINFLIQSAGILVGAGK